MKLWSSTRTMNKPKDPEFHYSSEDSDDSSGADSDFSAKSPNRRFTTCHRYSFWESDESQVISACTELDNHSRIYYTKRLCCIWWHSSNNTRQNRAQLQIRHSHKTWSLKMWSHVNWTVPDQMQWHLHLFHHPQIPLPWKTQTPFYHHVQLHSHKNPLPHFHQSISTLWQICSKQTFKF